MYLNILGSLRSITLIMAKEMRQCGLFVTPGEKLCPSCRKETTLKLKPGIQTDSETEGSDENMDAIAREYETNTTRESLNSTLKELEMSPLRSHSVPQYSKVVEGKRKLKKINNSFEEQVASCYSISVDEFRGKASNSTNDQELVQKATDLDNIVYQMKEKLKTCNRNQKIQVLTLTPVSWSIRKTATFFDVSIFIVRKSRRILKESGILSMPEKKKGRPLSDETITLVKQFYSDDEFSRQLPGKKDCVSIARNVHMQKRLILCSLNELYIEFKKRNPLVKVGISRFCCYRPKWCINVNTTGTHSVCVCTYHQNVTLLLNVVNLSKSCHELIELIVCSRYEKDCMVHRCDNCPGTAPLISFLEKELVKNKHDGDEEIDDGDVESEDDSEVEIKFSQWARTDRMELIKQTTSVEEFMEILVKKLDTLTAHSYIAKTQAQYLKDMKEKLKEKEVIVLLDFAENYQYIIQDEIQSYHWNKGQCTIHPVVIYYTENDKLKEKSLCFVSDDLDHDVEMVYHVIQETVSYIKESLVKEVTFVHYFSDGCAEQYKNCKNFLNLYHKSDFFVDCSWSFFATSHGKSPCDGVGGTVKTLAYGDHSMTKLLLQCKCSIFAVKK